MCLFFTYGYAEIRVIDRHGTAKLAGFDLLMIEESPFSGAGPSFIHKIHGGGC